MSFRRLMICLLALGLLWGWGVSEQASFAAQSVATPNAASQPRAQSQQEFEAYQAFMEESNPERQIQLVEDFLFQFPDTQLKQYAFQVAMQAYQAKNDYDRVLTYGELTLGENRNNLTALLILASAIPEATNRNDPEHEEKLADAEDYARRALEVLSRMPRPEHLSEEEWARARRETEATPRAALGLIAMIREDLTLAERELRRAVELAARPDPVTLYRLGLCYSLQKKYDLALEALDRASQGGGVKITTPEGLGRDLVAEAREFVLKAKAALGTSESEPAARTTMPVEAGPTP
ncbi:MAG: hypothetical protein A3H27_03940 [Acidobacteria bacterium RIFCSPLOWO2_02_FULL_59_13]|nr:MAG: hypothetical protein A3H27_03940 [Acidobacteria bacterium RIFCSPLOWO2_02_FULL_59_13]